MLGIDRGVGAGGISKSRRFAKCRESDVGPDPWIRLFGDGVRPRDTKEARSGCV
jgi:hypothetical protein